MKVKAAGMGGSSENPCRGADHCNEQVLRIFSPGADAPSLSPLSRGGIKGFSRH